MPTTLGNMLGRLLDGGTRQITNLVRPQQQQPAARNTSGSNSWNNLFNSARDFASNPVQRKPTSGGSFADNLNRALAQQPDQQTPFSTMSSSLSAGTSPNKAKPSSAKKEKENTTSLEKYMIDRGYDEEAGMLNDFMTTAAESSKDKKDESSDNGLNADISSTGSGKADAKDISASGTDADESKPWSMNDSLASAGNNRASLLGEGKSLTPNPFDILMASGYAQLETNDALQQKPDSVDDAVTSLIGGLNDSWNPQQAPSSEDVKKWREGGRPETYTTDDIDPSLYDLATLNKLYGWNREPEFNAAGFAPTSDGKSYDRYYNIYDFTPEEALRQNEEDIRAETEAQSMAMENPGTTAGNYQHNKLMSSDLLDPNTGEVYKMSDGRLATAANIENLSDSEIMDLMLETAPEFQQHMVDSYGNQWAEKDAFWNDFLFLPDPTDRTGKAEMLKDMLVNSADLGVDPVLTAQLQQRIINADDQTNNSAYGLGKAYRAGNIDDAYIDNALNLYFEDPIEIARLLESTDNEYQYANPFVYDKEAQLWGKLYANDPTGPAMSGYLGNLSEDDYAAYMIISNELARQNAGMFDNMPSYWSGNRSIDMALLSSLFGGDEAGIGTGDHLALGDLGSGYLGNSSRFNDKEEDGRMRFKKPKNNPVMPNEFGLGDLYNAAIDNAMAAASGQEVDPYANIGVGFDAWGDPYFQNLSEYAMALANTANGNKTGYYDYLTPDMIAEIEEAMATASS